jgi:hypothetical protein
VPGGENVVGAAKIEIKIKIKIKIRREGPARPR